MKNAKQIFSLLLVVCMALTFMIPAFADNTDTDKGSIELKNPQMEADGTTPVEYTAYKIFDVSYENVQTGTPTNYAYTIASDSQWYETVSTFAGTAANGLILTAVDGTSNPTIYNVTIDEEKFSAADFAKALKAAVSGKTGTKLEATTSNTVKAENLELGYWMVHPTAGSLVSLTTTDKDVEIIDKNDPPKVEKTVGNAEEGTKDKINQANIGDTISFTLSTTIPDMSSYEKYYFVFNDTLSKGLTYSGSVVVKLGTATIDASDYNVKTKINDDGTTTLRIVMKDMKGNYSDDQGEKMVATYTAVLNEDAVINGANTNTAYMEFSNDPSVIPVIDPSAPPSDPDDPDDPAIYDPEKPGAKDPTGNGPESKTETWTTKLVIKKIDESGNKLTGAKFRLEGTNAGNIIVTTGKNYLPYAPVPYYSVAADTYVAEDALANDKNLYDPQTYTQVVGTGSNVSYVAYDKEDVYYKIKQDKLGAWVTVAPTDATKALYVAETDGSIKAYTRSGNAEPYTYTPYAAPAAPTFYYELNDGTFTAVAPNENTWSKYAQENIDPNDPKFELDKVVKYVLKETYTEDTTGTWYKLTDGTYTDVAPTDPTPATYVSPVVKYKKTSEYVVYVPETPPTLYYQLKNDSTAQITTADLPANAKDIVDAYVKDNSNEIKLNGTYYKQLYTTTKPATDATPVKMVLRGGALADYAQAPTTPYYKLKDGTFTSTAPTAAGVNIDAYVNDGTDAAPVYTVYELVETYDYDTKATTPEVAEAFVNDDGVLVFKGLGAGTYTLTEVVAPDGYNAIDPLTITVVFDVKNADGDTDEIEFYIDELANDKDRDGKKDSDFMMEMNVVNVNGTKLPETGGLGTVIFVVLGTILFGATALVLVTKKRLYNEGC